ncbi:MAG: shikimate kinase [Acidobacteriia bacterium]|nr:shikimate kinase [Terriglobia bacterium]
MPIKTPHGPAIHAPILCLAGFMGSGKSTVGTALSRQLAWRFTDLDERIEEAAGLTIPQIFEKFGEPAFRQLEHEQLKLVIGRVAERNEPTVLALGGGTYAQPANVELLRAADIPVIWLDCPLETLLNRCLTMTGRPLFRDESSFRALYQQRLPSYQQAAYRVDSSGETSAVVAGILDLGIVTPGDPENLIVGRRPS